MVDHTLSDLVRALDGMPWCEDQSTAAFQGALEVARATLHQQRMRDAAQALLAALQQTWAVIDSAGLHALTRCVELGPTVWFVKAQDARKNSMAAIAEATGSTS